MKFSIKKKTILMIFLFGMVLVITAGLVCARIITGITNSQYNNHATHLASTVADIIDTEEYLKVRDEVLKVFHATENKVSSEEWGSDEFNTYIARFSYITDLPEFKSVQSYLRGIQDVNEVNCIYLVYVDAANDAGIYIIDAAPEEDSCPPGCFDRILEQNKTVYTDPERGFPPYTTNTEEYGWLVTSGTPIHSSDGAVIGYAMVDISMESVRATNIRSILQLFAVLLISIMLLCVAGVIIIDRILVKPIKQLSVSAEGFCHDDSSIEKNVFAKLRIRTGDEIQALSESMKKMETNLNDHIKQLLSVNKELTISKNVANEMTELANTDSLTGVRSKTSYDSKMAELENGIKSKDAKFGIVMIDLNSLKHINDTYGHECGNHAIIELCKIICEVFRNSPVYRIGGDEFAVVVADKDYDGIKELFREFNNRMSIYSSNPDLEPWTAISAAIGYALYDPEKDHSTTDVFNRADEEMYKNKNNMKNK